FGGAAGTVTNYGSIVTRNGIEMLQGGTVRNGQTNAVISTGSGGSIGIFIDGGVGSIANLGTVTAAGTSGGDAIFLYDGGSVVNGGAGDTAALIKDDFTGKDTGIEFRKIAGTVTNYGTISG